MKTKALLVAGLILSASAASSIAQVFSVNAVGFVNITCRSNGFSLISNPLNAAANTIPALLTSVPDGTSVFKFNPVTGRYNRMDYISGIWFSDLAGNAPFSVVPGEGFFLKNPANTNITITFVGNVQQGTNLVTSLPVNFSIASSQVPQAGLLESTLGFPAMNGDTIFTFNQTTQRYVRYDKISNFWFGPAGLEEPQIAVGESMFVKINPGNQRDWVRSFSVN